MPTPAIPIPDKKAISNSIHPDIGTVSAKTKGRRNRINIKIDLEYNFQFPVFFKLLSLNFTIDFYNKLFIIDFMLSPISTKGDPVSEARHVNRANARTSALPRDEAVEGCPRRVAALPDTFLEPGRMEKRSLSDML